MKRALLVALGVMLVALAVYPMHGTGYGVRTMLQLFMWIALWLRNERLRSLLPWQRTAASAG